MSAERADALSEDDPMRYACKLIEVPNPAAFRRELAQTTVISPVLFAGLAFIFLGLVGHLLSINARIDRASDVVAAGGLRALLREMSDAGRIRPDRSGVRGTNGAEAGGRAVVIGARLDLLGGASESLRSDVRAFRALAVDRRAAIVAIRGPLSEFLGVEEALHVRRNNARRRLILELVWVSLGASAILGLILAIAARRQRIAVSRCYDALLADARRQAEAVLEREAILGSFYDNAPMMMGISEISGDDLRMISVNAPTARPLGLTPDAMRGRLASEFGISTEDRLRWIEAYLESERTGRPMRFEYQYEHPGGRAWLSAVGCPLAGFPGRFTFIVQDNSDRRQAEEALRENRERLRAALTASDTGTYRWDLRTGAVEGDENLYRLFGLPPDWGPRRVDGFVGLIHPADREEVAAAVDRCVEHGEDLDREFRLVRPDGTMRWIANKGRAFFDAVGQPIYMTGACVDVTARRAADESIRALNAQLRRRLERRAALRRIDEVIVAGLDLRQTLAFVLDELVTLLGVDAAVVLAYDAERRELIQAADKGFRAPAGARDPLPVDGSVPGLVVSSGRHLALPDLSESPVPFLRASAIAEEGFSAYHVVPLFANGQVRGVLEVFHRGRLDVDGEWLEYLQTCAKQAAIAIENAWLLDGLRRSNAELAAAYDATIEGWARALDLRDQETEGHSRRVTEAAVFLARAMGMADADLVHLRRGALLHDIGKVGIPDRILLKAGPLDDEEWAIMRRHPTYALEMLRPISFLGPALEIPYCHHERWDGTGYPRALKGEEIPLSARIFAVVDIWDALGNDRPYRPAWGRERVRDHIASLADTHLDPRVVAAFLAILDERSPSRRCDPTGRGRPERESFQGVLAKDGSGNAPAAGSDRAPGAEIAGPVTSCAIAGVASHGS
jgi:PAS domain S-box-containing protein/putative nucleotidyltransferase with HDIG domain